MKLFAITEFLTSFFNTLHASGLFLYPLIRHRDQWHETSLTLLIINFNYHIETSPLICSANQWTGFYMISASVMKGLNVKMLGQCKKQINISLNFCWFF